MSTMTDKALALIPTLRAAIIALDEALDAHDETPAWETHARVFTEADVSARADDVRIALDKIERSITNL